MGFSRIWIW